MRAVLLNKQVWGNGNATAQEPKPPFSEFRWKKVDGKRTIVWSTVVARTDLLNDITCKCKI